MWVINKQLVLDYQHREDERAAAPKHVRNINWKRRILTGDALYCQIELCEAIVQDGDDYLVVARGNQPQLLEELEMLFAAPQK